MKGDFCVSIDIRSLEVDDTVMWKRLGVKKEDCKLGLICSLLFLFFTDFQSLPHHHQCSVNDFNEVVSILCFIVHESGYLSRVESSGNYTLRDGGHKDLQQLVLRAGITKRCREQGISEKKSRVPYMARNKSVTTSSYPFSPLFN